MQLGVTILIEAGIIEPGPGPPARHAALGARLELDDWTSKGPDHSVDGLDGRDDQPPEFVEAGGLGHDNHVVGPGDGVG